MKEYRGKQKPNLPKEKGFPLKKGTPIIQNKA